MNELLVDWSRAQFALTAMYHWLFVPLTLGLAVIMGIMETMYVRTGKEEWKRAAKFWIKIFGINFAIGVATGLILEFQFGTNWSNYSWFVGDIFGAPLAIEGIFAFFMEATFFAVMFFGWDKVSKKAHVWATWLTGIGATMSAWWILVANAWMQNPIGTDFNAATVRHEMTNFWAIAGSPVAVNKFFHAVLSGWTLAAVFVIGISCYYLIKKRNLDFAMRSIRVAAIIGLFSSLMLAFTGDKSAYLVGKYQPMKLAAAEGLYDGGHGIGLVGFGILNPEKKPNDNQESMRFEIQFPNMLSLLATRSMDGYVPGINNIINGGYTLPDGSVALSTHEKIEKGKVAIEALHCYRLAMEEQNQEKLDSSEMVLKANMPYFGYGYIEKPEDIVPNVTMNFYAFRIMVILGGYFILLFLIIIFLSWRKKLEKQRWLQWIALLSIPLAYIAGQAGWIVSEVGRQPWTIQDMLPVNAAISSVNQSSVLTTFIIFAVLFTVLLIAEVGIMIREIVKGPEENMNTNPEKTN